MGNRREYEIALAIGGRVNSTFARTVQRYNQNVRGMQRQTGTFQNSLKSLGNGFKALGAAAVAYVGFSAIKGFMSESIELAKAQISAEVKLETVLKQRTNATDEQINALKMLASEQQNVGVVGDEVQIAGMQQIATFVKNTDSINSLLPAMNNLLVQQKGLSGTQEDAVNIANMMGKVLDGQVGSLKRIGISFSAAQEKVLKYGTEQQRASMLAQVITDNVGDMNKEMAKTDQGKIQQAINAYGDMKEQIGMKLLPIQAKFAKIILDNMPKIQKVLINVVDGFVWLGDKIIYAKNIGVRAFNQIKDAISKNREKLQPLIDIVMNLTSEFKDKLPLAIDLAKEGFEYFTNTLLPEMISNISEVVTKSTELFNFISDNWGAIEPIVAGVAGSIFAYQLYMQGAYIATGIGVFFLDLWAASCAIATAVTTGFGVAVAFVTSPLGLIIIGIGLLVAVIVLLYRNWDTVSKILVNEWLWVKSEFAGAGEWFSGIFTRVVDGIKGAFSGFGEWFSNLWDGIVGLFKGYVNIYIKIANMLINGLNTLEVNIPDWVPKFGGKSIGVNIKPIPELYKGTNFFSGGTALVGERGPELVNLNRGSQVIPNNKTEQLLNGFGNSGSGVNINYAPVFHVSGGDSKTVENANNKALDDFERMLNRVLSRRKRLSF